MGCWIVTFDCKSIKNHSTQFERSFQNNKNRDFRMPKNTKMVCWGRFRSDWWQQNERSTKKITTFGPKQSYYHAFIILPFLLFSRSYYFVVLFFFLKQKKLFAGYSFFLQGDFTNPSKEEMMELISVGGGIVITSIDRIASKDRLFATTKRTKILCNATNITQNEATDLLLKSGLNTIDFNWFLDCISSYNIIDDSRYSIVTAGMEQTNFETQNSLPV